MGLIVKENENTDFKPCPAGTHVAICTGLVDLGLQVNKFDTSKAPREKVALFWTLPDVLREDGNPFVVREVYTATLNKNKQGTPSKLRSCLDAWRGVPFTEEDLKGFDLTKILCKPCMLSIVHEEKKEGGVYANINSVLAMMKGMPIPELPESSLILHFDTENPSLEDFQKLPEWVQNMIRQSVEWEAIFSKMNTLEGVPNS
ncbi:MAG: phage replication initiation protein, NGO0469 family [Bacteroidota bacterium]|jgi:hypothetical protein